MAHPPGAASYALELGTAEYWVRAHRADAWQRCADDPAA